MKNMAGIELTGERGHQSKRFTLKTLDRNTLNDSLLMLSPKNPRP